MRLMDVTIRESVYYGSGIGYKEGLEYLSNLSRFVDKEDLDYIEICYINTDEIGHLNYNSKYIKDAYDICGKHFKLVGMMHPDKVEIEKWDTSAIRLLSMVRIVCGGDDIPSNVGPLISFLHNLGVEVSVNISFAMRRSFQINKNLCIKAVSLGADYVYFADSSGSATPDDIRTLCHILKETKNNNRIGLHLHDHLGLSLANALAANDCGIDITDVSITGAGRGGGNLKTEFIVPFLKFVLHKELKQSLFDKLLDYIEYFNLLVKRDGHIYKQFFLDTLSGFCRLSLKEQDTYEKEANGDGHKYISLVFKGIKNL